MKQNIKNLTDKCFMICFVILALLYKNIFDVKSLEKAIFDLFVLFNQTHFCKLVSLSQKVHKIHIYAKF